MWYIECFAFGDGGGDFIRFITGGFACTSFACISFFYRSFGPPFRALAGLLLYIFEFGFGFALCDFGADSYLLGFAGTREVLWLAYYGLGARIGWLFLGAKGFLFRFNDTRVTGIVGLRLHRRPVLCPWRRVYV